MRMGNNAFIGELPTELSQSMCQLLMTAVIKSNVMTYTKDSI